MPPNLEKGSLVPGQDPAQSAPAPTAAGPKRDQPGVREAFLSALLHMEQRARDAASQEELAYVIVNGMRKITAGQQVFLMELAEGSAKVRAVSDVTAPDRNTPFIQWIERVARRMAEDVDAGGPQTFSLPAYCDADDEEANTYPFGHFSWVPLKTRDGAVFAGVLQARDTIWRDSDVAASMHLAGVYQHAWQALSASGAIRRPKSNRRWFLLAAAVAVIAASFIPVPLTAIAPAEVVAKDPLVIAAPLDGVIETVAAEPNAPVQKGDVLFRYNGIVFRNKYQIAEQAVDVASVKFRRYQQAALGDAEARHKMAIARAELSLALRERDYAREVLAKTVVTAPAAGIVILASKDYWKGRPVSTGEQIMQIARPDAIELSIDLPVRDAIVLHEGADVNVYLDAAPLSKIKARLTHASYQAEPSETHALVYHVRAAFAEKPAIPLRIGARGTAQIFGETVPLVLYLLRRPISVIRQSIGL